MGTLEFLELYIFTDDGEERRLNNGLYKDKRGNIFMQGTPILFKAKGSNKKWLNVKKGMNEASRIQRHAQRFGGYQYTVKLKEWQKEQVPTIQQVKESIKEQGKELQATLDRRTNFKKGSVKEVSIKQEMAELEDLLKSI